MRLHLLHNDGTYSDLADYAENTPFAAPEGAQWQEGEPGSGVVQHVILSLAEKLEVFYEQLPVAKRVQYGPLKSEAKAFLEQPKPDLEAVKYLISNAPIVAEDESIRQSMLTAFS